MDATARKTAHAPPATADARLSFETRSLDWSVDHATRQTALFRCYPGVAVLQHIRTVEVRSDAPASGCEIDTDARPADVPADVLDELRGDGFDVVAGRTA
jgi:hypothetical protein